MLPQKISLDVIIEKQTESQVTCEINGENSGYQGLTVLGDGLSHSIIGMMGNALRGQNILVNPAFSELYFARGTLGRLRSEFGITVTFSQLIPQPIEPEEFEAEFGKSFYGFDAVLGFGNCFVGSGLEERMINSPAVEIPTWDKLVQYELLKDIPGLNLPETWSFNDGPRTYQMLHKLQETYGKLVWKPRTGAWGAGIVVVTPENITDIISSLLESSLRKASEAAPEPLKNQLDTISFGGNSGLYDAKEQQGNGLKWVLTRTSLETIKVSRAVASTIIQRFVETEPVVYEKTGERHHASARLIWFGEYLGGYWRLSANPISDKDPMNAILNFTRNKLSQKFTPEEAEMFRAYAESVVPPILQRLSLYNGRVEEYERVEALALQRSLQEFKPLAFSLFELKRV